ncbi:hypothetical protein EC604_23130 [Paenibacillus amylolyticus]|uniref:Uncharacterized protein n=2 Tax=Paenibacillus amylolyticus TaxID=1451 RepID=A0A5M9WYR4_PAEAM|nr:hypothetical protein EC604_23130 [Paenibacillus amylolyticus]
MTLATLYQVWEQQVRELSFEEITRHHHFVDKKGMKLEFKNFCTTFGEIKNLFLNSDWQPTSVTSWDTINELQLVQNVIKHGDGAAADQLKSIQPGYFKEVNGTLIMDLYNSTLNEIALSIPNTAIVEGQEHGPIEVANLAAFLFYRYKFLSLARDKNLYRLPKRTTT